MLTVDWYIGVIRLGDSVKVIAIDGRYRDFDSDFAVSSHPARLKLTTIARTGDVPRAHAFAKALPSAASSATTARAAMCAWSGRSRWAPLWPEVLAATLLVAPSRSA